MPLDNFFQKGNLKIMKKNRPKIKRKARKTRKAGILRRIKLFKKAKRKKAKKAVKKLKRPRKLKKAVLRKKRKVSKARKVIKRAKKSRKVKAVKSRKKAIRKTVKRTARKKVSKKPKKVIVKPETFDLSSNSIFRPKIRVIGVGGGGGSIVSEIGRSLEKASFVIADTDVRAIKKKSGIKYFYFGEEVTHGLGTGMNPDLARRAAENEKERITKLLEDQDIIILVASLGGGLGSGAAPIFAEISKNLGNVTLGIFTLPFKFEGSKKSSISHRAINNLRNQLNALITISNEKIFKVVNEKTSITEAFSLVNKNLIESLESLIDLIYNPGVINIDFADVRTTLKGRGMMAFLNTVESSGKNRAEDIASRIFSNPLFNLNIKAEKMLFNISGGNNLSMVEVDKISRAIAELNPKAKIIFGISKNLKAKGKIKTTLLVTGPSYISVREPEPAKKIIPITKKAKVSERKKKIKISKKKNIKSNKKQSLSSSVIRTSIPIMVGTSSESMVLKKEMIRRNALEVKKAQEMEENKRLKQEAEWEIPAFLRKMRFKA